MANHLRCKTICSISDFLIFASSTNTRFFKHHISKIPSEILLNGIDIQKRQKYIADEKYRRAFSYKRGERIVGMMGLLNHLKGADIFLEAMEKVATLLPDVKFVVAGSEFPPSPEYVRHLKEIAQRPLLRGKVFFPGFCKNVPSFMNCLDVFVLASRNESMPLTILEAMAAECAIVATDVGCVREMLNAPIGGLVIPPENPQLMADAVIKFLEDDIMRETLGKQAYHRVQSTYSMDIFCKKINSILNRVLKNPPHKP
jgi:glycosyltransferase involved in cell wall biosynthesis